MLLTQEELRAYQSRIDATDLVALKARYAPGTSYHVRPISVLELQNFEKAHLMSSGMTKEKCHEDIRRGDMVPVLESFDAGDLAGIPFDLMTRAQQNEYCNRLRAAMVGRQDLAPVDYSPELDLFDEHARRTKALGWHS